MLNLKHAIICGLIHSSRTTCCTEQIGCFSSSSAAFTCRIFSRLYDSKYISILVTLMSPESSRLATEILNITCVGLSRSRSVWSSTVSILEIFRLSVMY